MYEPDSSIEAMAWEAVEALPESIRERLNNVAVTVEDWARPDDYPNGRVGRGALLGVYRGVPLTRRTSSYGMVLPDRIVIFERPLRRLARDEEHLRELVHHTVRHEIAHHFGISDARLRELDAY
jgi:predicted Zn-dependent protease with MMP-like domain